MPLKPKSHAQLLRESKPETHGRSFSDRANHEQRANDPLQAEADRLRSSGRWKRLSSLKRARDPLCEGCLRHGETVPAVDVDHIVPVLTLIECGQRERAFALEGLQSLCRACHCSKTSAETTARARGLAPRDATAIAAVLSHVEHLPVEEALRRVEGAVARGENHLEIPHV